MLYQVVKQEGKFKVGMGKIKKLLQNQDAYSLQKSTQIMINRRRVVVKGIDYQWEADLADVQHLSEHNNGIKFLLVIVDVFSRFLWVRPLKDRKAKSVIRAFKDVLTGPRRPQAIRTDKGSEFYNRFLKSISKTKKLRHYMP